MIMAAAAADWKSLLAAATCSLVSFVIVSLSGPPAGCLHRAPSALLRAKQKYLVLSSGEDVAREGCIASSGKDS